MAPADVQPNEKFPQIRVRCFGNLKTAKIDDFRGACIGVLAIRSVSANVTTTVKLKGLHPLRVTRCLLPALQRNAQTTTLES